MIAAMKKRVVVQALKRTKTTTCSRITMRRVQKKEGNEKRNLVVKKTKS